MTTPRIVSTGFAALALLASGSAFAQSKTWQFDDQTAPGSCSQFSAGGSNNLGNAWSCSTQPDGTSASLVVTAWSSTGSNFTSAAVKQNGAGSGFGVGNATEGGINASGSNFDHSMDNGNGNGTDLLLLSFTNGPEALSKVTVGWSGADGDFQVLRWKNSYGPNWMSDYTLGNAVASGWELVSLVTAPGGINDPNYTYNVNGSALKSSYWLISAYNSAFGGSTGDTTADSLKVLGVSVLANGVPEPTSLALVAVALGGAAVGSRRRRG